MIRIGAGVVHHDEAQHDHYNDDFWCVGDGPEIATDTEIDTNTHNVTIR